jgi:hypothetical protein
VASPAYVASPWCAAEVGIADVLGCPLLPVRAGPHAESTLLDGLAHLDFGADDSPARTRAREELVERLRRLDAAGGLGWEDGRSPFPGLRPFECRLGAETPFSPVANSRQAAHQTAAGYASGRRSCLPSPRHGCGGPRAQTGCRRAAGPAHVAAAWADGALRSALATPGGPGGRRRCGTRPEPTHGSRRGHAGTTTTDGRGLRRLRGRADAG